MKLKISETTTTTANHADVADLVALNGIGRVFTYQEAWGILRVSRSELFRRLRTGSLKAVGTGRAKRITEAELVRHLAASEAASKLE